MKTRIVAINGSAGAWTSISATQITRRVEIIEDASANAGAAQGLQYQFDDGQVPPFTSVYQILAGDEPLILGDPVPQGRGYGPVIGVGPQSSGGSSMPATLLCKIRSLSATATAVRISEFD